jgi:predicted 3-demethylubiquinone-9 3-methyltransferase (glyoxalase superfamily)/uncharacterized protein YndB with AHSA1/START domain
MQKINFSVAINATPECVWQILWDDHSYRGWTSIFQEGSYAESDWQEGSKVLFLDGQGKGMVSTIARLVPQEVMSFKHLGVIKDGAEDFSTDFGEAYETYFLKKTADGTELVVELDSDPAYTAYFEGVFPSALQLVKSMSEAQKITPFLWFDQDAEAAVQLYTSLFSGSEVKNVMRNGDAVFSIDFNLAGQSFGALNGGPMFKFTPAVSYYVVCNTEAEVEALWNGLAPGGSVLMPLQAYPWSPKYGWLQDRFGLSWQIFMGSVAETGQKITPALLYTGAQAGKAETAIQLYTSVFQHAGINFISRYGAGGNDQEGTVNHAQFLLNGHLFAAMDSNGAHGFTFSEANSFLIRCYSQFEVDYYWEKLTAHGGEPGQCGWLKDPFGVSWQVVPVQLLEYFGHPDQEKAGRAIQAMMQMKKIDIAALKQAFEGNVEVAKAATVITVTAHIIAPIEKVWDCWTNPAHITQWCAASDDWHAPRAENDVRVGGAFTTRMEARDGSFGFDFKGTYTEVAKHEKIAYTAEDGRKVEIWFKANGAETEVIERFEPEQENPYELQQEGWQSILNNFAKYVQGH